MDAQIQILSKFPHKISRYLHILKPFDENFDYNYYTFVKTPQKHLLYNLIYEVNNTYYATTKNWLTYYLQTYKLTAQISKIWIPKLKS